MENKIIQVEIKDEIKKSYIDYAMSVIAARALPDVRDGLKPVHRRILYAMNELNLEPNKAYKKSARIVGDTMGKYHPHGDSSIYEAMVRMAQDFSMRYMLVDGHGNFGSIDGDGAAAPRYTEARLSYISTAMLTDIDKDTVDFIPNYDGEFSEPSVLPSKFPNLLANGSSGIAVGMATNIPPHNISELIDAIFKMIDCRMQNVEVELDDLLTIIKGPDFPTGASILGINGIKQAYKTGRGKIIMRASAEIETAKNGRESIIVTELPYQVNKSRMIEKIAELIKDKKIDGISDIRDETDRNGIRIVIEVKRDANANIVLNQLYKFSQLQETFGIIMLVLVDNEPKVLNLKEILNYYIEHQKNVLTRRTKFDLNKALRRQHILEGYLIALDHIDEVLNTIRSSKDTAAAKDSLMEKFNLSMEQATAIVEMRFRSLTGMERKKLEDEYAQINELVAELKNILEDENKLYSVLKDELAAIKNKYGDARRTKILPMENEIVIEDLIADEPSVITLTKFDYIKRLPLDTYKRQNRGGRGVIGMQMREEDLVKDIFVTNTHSLILYFTNLGRVYKNKAYEIPEAGRMAKGLAIVNLLKLNENEKISTVVPINESSADDYLIMVTKNGLVKKTSIAQFKNINRNGLQAISIRDNDELICVLKSAGNQKVFVATQKGFGITFNEDDIRPTGRTAMGVRAIKLSQNDKVVGAGLIAENLKTLFVSKNGFGKCVEYENFVVQKRGGKGRIYYKIRENKGEVIALEFVKDSDEVMLINSEGVIIRIRVSDISTQSRYATGVKLINLDKDSCVISTAKISEEQINLEQTNLEE